MRHLSSSYSENVSTLDSLLRVRESFDIIKKPLQVGSDEVTF